METIEIRRADGRERPPPQRVEAASRLKPSAGPPIRRNLAVASILTLAIAILVAGVSTVGLMAGSVGLYGDAEAARRVLTSTAGVLVPGFAAHDALNLVIGLPGLLGVLWLVRRGSLIGLLLWPGALFYVLYTYTTYVVGAPFSLLFLPHVTLVVLSAYTTIVVLTSIDGGRQKLAGLVPARTVGGILVALGLLTLAQDGMGAVFSGVTAASAAMAPVARHVMDR